MLLPSLARRTCATIGAVPRWLYAFLAFGAVAVMARALDWPPLLVFSLSALGIVPLAGLMGKATEDLAHAIGPKWGGLLNATFGNAAELIITVVALRAGLLELVKASITGSIIGNILLVLGTGLLLGGRRYGIQRFNAREAGANAALMLMALAAVVFPAVFHLTAPPGIDEEPVSIAVALVLLLLYAAYILYGIQPGEGPAEVPDIAAALAAPDEIAEWAGAGGATAAVAEAHEKTAAIWSVRVAVGALLAATVATVAMSELLVHAVEPVTHALGWSEFFVGVIVVPIIGNVAEHFSAVTLAAKNKVDVAMAIAAGSSTQIALLVAPVLVLASLLTPTPMDLVFHPLELAVMGASAAIFAYIAVDGESNWLEAVMLIGLYVMAAVVFFFLPGTPRG